MIERNGIQHYGSVAQMRATMKPDVFNALRISASSLDDLHNKLPVNGDKITEFQNTSLGRALAFDDSQLSTLKERVGHFVNHCTDTEFQNHLAKLFEHSEIAILPNPDDPNTASASLIVKDTYYEDPETKNHKLIELAAKLANKFDILNFYLPDVRTKHIKDTGTLSVFGGYKVIKFLDYDNNSFNSKQNIRSQIEAQDSDAFALRKMLDYGAASLDVNKSPRLTVKYPSYSYLGALGIPFYDEPSFTQYKRALDDVLVGPDGAPILGKSASQYDPNRKIANKSAKFAQLTDAKEVIARSLQDDTPAHIANLILSQDWLWDSSKNTVLLLPSRASETAFDYNISDTLNFARYFTNKSSIYPDMFESGNAEHEALFLKAEQNSLQPSVVDNDENVRAHIISFQAKQQQS
jgi:hypothetical protein